MQITCPNCGHTWETKLPPPGPVKCYECQWIRRDPERYPERQWLWPKVEDPEPVEEEE